MKIRLVFKTPFNKWFEQDETVVDIPYNSTVRIAVNDYLKRKEIYRIAKEKKALFMGELNAVFVVNESVVNRDYVLKENDTLTLLNMIIGG
jgi:molybdopterin converting factor small subunit